MGEDAETIPTTSNDGAVEITAAELAAELPAPSPAQEWMGEEPDPLKPDFWDQQLETIPDAPPGANGVGQCMVLTAEWFAAKGIHEQNKWGGVGSTNSGHTYPDTWINHVQWYCGYGNPQDAIGVPYCQCGWRYMMDVVLRKKGLPNLDAHITRTGSTVQMLAVARQNGWVVTTPEAGLLGLVLDATGGSVHHATTLIRPTADPRYWITVEWNCSDGVRYYKRLISSLVLVKVWK